jgi:hypothetical protein
MLDPLHRYPTILVHNTCMEVAGVAKLQGAGGCPIVRTNEHTQCDMGFRDLEVDKPCISTPQTLHPPVISARDVESSPDIVGIVRPEQMLDLPTEKSPLTYRCMSFAVL